MAGQHGLKELNRIEEVQPNHGRFREVDMEGNFSFTGTTFFRLVDIRGSCAVAYRLRMARVWGSCLTCARLLNIPNTSKSAAYLCLDNLVFAHHRPRAKLNHQVSLLHDDVALLPTRHHHVVLDTSTTTNS